MTQPGLSELFESALRETAVLLATLQEEFEALAKPDAAAIEEVVARKRALVATLDDKSKRHTAALQAAGYVDSMANMPEWLSHNDNTPDRRLPRLWQDFTAMLHNCQKQNQINGRVIDANRRRTRDALCILRGVEPEPVLYDPHGSTPAAVTSHPITMA